MTTIEWRKPYKTQKGRVLAIGKEEDPWVRLQFFRQTFAVLVHRLRGKRDYGCSQCRIMLYRCVVCGGVKCRCRAGDTYRHWERSPRFAYPLPIQIMEERELFAKLLHGEVSA